MAASLPCWANITGTSSLDITNLRSSNQSSDCAWEGDGGKCLRGIIDDYTQTRTLNKKQDNQNLYEDTIDFNKRWFDRLNTVKMLYANNYNNQMLANQGMAMWYHITRTFCWWKTYKWAKSAEKNWLWALFKDRVSLGFAHLYLFLWIDQPSQRLHNNCVWCLQLFSSHTVINHHHTTQNKYSTLRFGNYLRLTSTPHNDVPIATVLRAKWSDRYYIGGPINNLKDEWKN